MQTYIDIALPLILVAISIALSGCGASMQDDGEGDELGNETVVSSPSFPVYRKMQTAQFIAVPDGEDPTSDWMVKLDATWSKQQADAFIAAAEAESLAIRKNGKQIEILMIVIHTSLQKLVTFLKAYPTIEFVEEDGETHMIPELPGDLDTNASQNESLRARVPWGLDRIDQEELPMDRSSYTSGQGTGEGVHVYVLDTGIRTTHSDFGGRAIPTYDAFASERVCNPDDIDCAADRNGHGTHCAGTVGGNIYGVAKRATIHAVKILDDSGSGSTSDITGAIDWVIGSGERPAVISMSLGMSGRSHVFTRAIDSATEAGVTVVVASGNDSIDACGFTPSFVPSAITVGATNPMDFRAEWSNYGRCVDILAPGVDIKSATHLADFGSTTLSGTSMACPHVAGVAALLLAQDPNTPPLDKMLEIASSDKLRGLRGEPNKLLFVGTGGGGGNTSAVTPTPTRGFLAKDMSR